MLSLYTKKVKKSTLFIDFLYIILYNTNANSFNIVVVTPSTIIIYK